MSIRKATVTRETKETSIKVDLVIDGNSQSQITTGIRFFDHMLNQIAQHGVFNLNISASGADQHHIVEDVAITLGKAFNQALGNKQGIIRMAHALVPMDDVLALVALDISGRGYSVLDITFDHHSISDMSADLLRHFLVSFAAEARINLHARILAGINDHHKAEAVFNALARALDEATQIDERIEKLTPSTKDSIEC
jgi:imidazoleglycerol-phosphate dehydratase